MTDLSEKWRQRSTVRRHQNIVAIDLLILSTIDKIQIHTTAIAVIWEKNSTGVGGWLEEKVIMKSEWCVMADG